MPETPRPLLSLRHFCGGSLRARRLRVQPAALAQGQGCIAMHISVSFRATTYSDANPSVAPNLKIVGWVSLDRGGLRKHRTQLFRQPRVEGRAAFGAALSNATLGKFLLLSFTDYPLVLLLTVIHTG